MATERLRFSKRILVEGGGAATRRGAWGPSAKAGSTVNCSVCLFGQEEKKPGEEQETARGQ